MTEFFKSALDYLGSQNNGQDNNFVGQCVELGNQKLRVKKVIAEGLQHLKKLNIKYLKPYLLLNYFHHYDNIII